MSKPSLRRSILMHSVQRLVDDSERVHEVIMLWTRHRYFLPYSVFAAAVLFVVASVSGVEGTISRVVLAACGTAVAAMATTNHWVLASTSRGLVLCRSSRIRQYAKSIHERLPARTELTMVGSTVITSDWRIAGSRYTMTKRWEAAMRSLASEARS